jgi:hypothetical protein
MRRAWKNILCFLSLLAKLSLKWACSRSLRNFATTQIYCLAPHILLFTGCLTKYLRGCKVARASEIWPQGSSKKLTGRSHFCTQTWQMEFTGVEVNTPISWHPPCPLLPVGGSKMPYGIHCSVMSVVCPHQEIESAVTHEWTTNSLCVNWSKTITWKLSCHDWFIDYIILIQTVIHGIFHSKTKILFL